MGKPYSMDLRERVVAAVDKVACPVTGRRRSLGWASTLRFFGFGASENGSVAPGQMGGHKRKKISGSTVMVLERTKAKTSRCAGLCRTGRARAESPITDRVGVRPHRESELQKKASSPANATVLMSPAARAMAEVSGPDRS